MKISVVGLGLIGGSIALKLKDSFDIVGYDIDNATIKYINENNLFKASSDINIISDSDIIILALYPQMIKQWLIDHQNNIKLGALIIDTSGVKQQIFDEVLPILRSDLKFVGAHPMAGLEKSGINYAFGDLFKGANLIIVRCMDDDGLTETIFKHLEFKNITYLSAFEHDEVIGYLSQLTHVIAISLMNANDNPLLALYSGDSFRDLTRIAKINENLWSQLLMMNKQALISEIDSFVGEMNHFKQLLQVDDEAAIQSLMITSTKRRMEFDKK